MIFSHTDRWQRNAFGVRQLNAVRNIKLCCLTPTLCYGSCLVRSANYLGSNPGTST